WYNTMFTGRLSIMSRWSIFFFLSPYYVLDAMTSEYNFSNEKFFQGKLGNLILNALNKSANVLLVVAGVAIMTAVTFIFMNYPIVAGALAASIVIGVAMLAIMVSAR